MSAPTVAMVAAEPSDWPLSVRVPLPLLIQSLLVPSLPATTSMSPSLSTSAANAPRVFALVYDWPLYLKGTMLLKVSSADHADLPYTPSTACTDQ